jgi:hypothetical protein
MIAAFLAARRRMAELCADDNSGEQIRVVQTRRPARVGLAATRLSQGDDKNRLSSLAQCRQERRQGLRIARHGT